MTELTAGMEAPDFTLESDAGTPVSLSALRGNGVVLYFYPKDNTAGCTTCRIFWKGWGGRWDSNPRQPESQSGTLPTELHPPFEFLRSHYCEKRDFTETRRFVK